ncbi:MAG: hypothetical protein AAFP85_15290 [Pseudomonadota bacterium]
MGVSKFAALTASVLSGCSAALFPPIATDRTGYSDAWYYERLTPYYTNNIYFEPRVHLRAVNELVGIPVVFENGFHGHADVLRPDIELFFAAPVTSIDDRIELARRAVEITCPSTDLMDIASKVEFSGETYVVLVGLPCVGHAGQ